MKLRESGMPPQDYWESLLNVSLILDRFDIGPAVRDVVELGCGYGTFTLPVAQRISGVVYAFDIDSEMTEATRRRAIDAGLSNVRVGIRDVVADGFGLPEGSTDAVLLFNILHCESPISLLREAAQVLRPGGRVAVIHWRSDITTPRGPSADIRPHASQIANWAAETALLSTVGSAFELPPWHYGVKLVRKKRT